MAHHLQMMIQMTRSLDLVFEAYIIEGRELGVRELRGKYPRAVKAAQNACPGLTIQQIMLKVRKVYSRRWHEINQKPTESVASLSILDKMRMAAQKVENE